MVYKSRLSSRESNHTVPTEAPIPTYLDVHPLSDYEPIGRLRTAWIGLHRLGSPRQKVTVERVYQTNLGGLQSLARIVHHNIAATKALYCVNAELYVVYEYVELDIFDLPMSQLEIATVMSQVQQLSPSLNNDRGNLLRLFGSQAVKAVYHLIGQNVGFRIGTIRITITGRVKLGMGIMCLSPYCD